MKKILLAIMLLAGATANAAVHKGTNSLTWTYSTTEMQLIDGFKIYCGTTVVWTGTAKLVQLSTTTLTRGVHTCYVKAYAGTTLSDPSNSVVIKYAVGKPVKPTSLIIK